MGRLVDRLWLRYRHRYVLVTGIGVTALGIGGVTLPVLLPFLPLLGGSLEQSAAVVLLTVAGEAMIGAITTVTLMSRLRPIADWGASRSGSPLVVWNVALRAPRMVAERAAVFVVLGHLLVIVPLIAAILQLSATETLALEVVMLPLEAASLLLVGISARMLFRPLVDELTPLLPPVAVPTGRDWSLAGRFLVASWVIGAACGVVGAVGTSQDDSLARPMSLGLAIGALASLMAVGIMGVGMVLPSLRPLRDLREAAARVRQGDYTTPLPVTTADEMGDLVVSFNEMQHGLREREALHAAFGSYVDPALAQRLLDSGSSMFDGEDVVVTVLFADVRDFTAYSEGVDPAEAVALLNRLFDVVVPVLHEHGGHANHYLGDGLLAVFGAPNPLPTHADAAVRSSVEIQRLVRQTLGPDLRLGIGINTGRVIAGTVGGGGRLEFTVIGDTVNLAARVEQLTKDTGDSILITEATRAALSTPRPRSTKRGEFTVRGKATKVTLHAVNPFPRSTR